MCTVDHGFKQTYWWILPVQFLLLREEVQTVLQRHLPPRASLGNGQGQIAEHIKGVGVVWAHWAVQRATQLSREQVCIRKMNTAVRHWNALMEPPSEGPFLTYYSAVISLQVLFPHDSCFLGNPMGQNDNLTEHDLLIYCTKWKILFQASPESGIFLFRLLHRTANIGPAVDLHV